MNYRTKIKHILSFSPWPRLPNRQSHVDLRSSLSALIIWTHRGNMQWNPSLFHYFEVNRRRRLAGWGDYYRLFPLQPSISFLQPKRQERGFSQLRGWIKALADWLSTWLQEQNNPLPSHSFPRYWMKALKSRITGWPSSQQGTTQKHPSACPKQPGGGGDANLCPGSSTCHTCTAAGRLPTLLQGFLRY